MNIGVSPGIVSENNKGSLIIPLIKRVMTKEYHKTDTSKVFFILPICMKKKSPFLNLLLSPNCKFLISFYYKRKRVANKNYLEKASLIPGKKARIAFRDITVTEHSIV